VIQIRPRLVNWAGPHSHGGGHVSRCRRSCRVTGCPKPTISAKPPLPRRQGR